MFAFFNGASFKIARNLIKVTGLAESLAVFQKNTFSNIEEGEVLKLLLAVDACNLMQTMREDFIHGEIYEEDLQDTVEDYLVENLKAQVVIPCRDGAERMEQCQEILAMTARFQEYWVKEECKDPGPRFYCVKELLGRLGSEANTPIHDNLFEFVYEQHNRFIRYFRTLLEPMQAEDVPEQTPGPPTSAVSLHNPSPEPLPGTQATLTEEEMVPEEALGNPEARVESNPFVNPTQRSLGEEAALEIGKVLPNEDLFPTKSLSLPPAGTVEGKTLFSL